MFLLLPLFSKELGPDVSVYNGEELKWEDGAYGYFVMFKSLLDESGSCVEDQTEKTYTLDEPLIPPDAYVERAFLIWTGAQPVDKIDELTDSEVTLRYKSTDGNIEETKVVTANGYKVSEPQEFEFDSFIESDDSGRSYFTYRVDVTDFFKSIHDKGRELGVESDGDSLQGDYTVSDLDCATDQIYSENGTTVSGWAITIIYKSYLLAPAKIAVFDSLQEVTEPINPEDFGCTDPDQKCTLLTNNGAFDLFSFENDSWNIANLLIASEETTSSNFDIPGQPELVACTPANFPVNPENPDSFWCSEGYHTFAIRIQNWGNTDAENIIVKTEIPEGMEYVLGSTEYSDEFSTLHGNKIAKNWKKIPDKAGIFPLIDGYKIADNMNFCGTDSDYLSCENTIMVRFIARVKYETQKNAVIENIANIATYTTNLGIPLKLKLATSGCVLNHDDINIDECGGTSCCGCVGDEDCAEGYICDTESGICILDPSILRCADSIITAKIGKNSPNNDTIFISPEENLVIGQLSIVAASGSDCFFNLSELKLKIKLDDDNISINNIRLINDHNGNGAFDPEETYLNSSDLDKGFVEFNSSDPFNRLWANRLNYLIFVADISYKEGETIPKTATFTPSIEAGGILIVDDGEPEITGLPVLFSKFQLEPDNAFIITKGPLDPPVPERTVMNGKHEILQFKAISKGTADKIKSITIKIPDEELIGFGDKISYLSVYADENNDGIGEELIVRAEKTDSGRSHKFNVDIPFEDGISKYFTVRADLNLHDGDYFQIQISDIEIESDKEIFGLPVNSKEYLYECDPMYEDCSEPCCSPYPCSILFL